MNWKKLVKEGTSNFGSDPRTIAGFAVETPSEMGNEESDFLWDDIKDRIKELPKQTPSVKSIWYDPSNKGLSYYGTNRETVDEALACISIENGYYDGIAVRLLALNIDEQDIRFTFERDIDLIGDTLEIEDMKWVKILESIESDCLGNESEFRDSIATLKETLPNKSDDEIQDILSRMLTYVAFDMYDGDGNWYCDATPKNGSIPIMDNAIKSLEIQQKKVIEVFQIELQNLKDDLEDLGAEIS